MTNRPKWTDRATTMLLAGILTVLAYGLFFDRPPLESPQFEYRTRLVGQLDDGTVEILEQQLDAMGADGWELVSFDTQQYDDKWNPTTARVSMRRRRR